MPLIELEQVTHFYGRCCALRDVTLCVERGAIGLVGQNGAGKSTLLKIALGLIRPTSGSGRVLGYDIRASGAELRGRVGYMPETESLLLGLRGAEAVALAGELSGMPRRHALRRAHEVLWYVGLEEARYRKLDEYSVGMKQRLKLATALVHDPELLLLDEPTSGLDPDGRDTMLRLLHRLAHDCGKSLLFSTHLLGDIDRVCDAVVIVDRGQVCRVGQIEELRQHYRGVYRLQWDGAAGEAFLDDLRIEGAQVVANGRPSEAVVHVPDRWQPRLFFALADNHGLVLRGIEHEREDLESLYHRVLGLSPMPAAAEALPPGATERGTRHAH
jgi:ABC-2 type transport system ATP-binding protein